MKKTVWKRLIVLVVMISVAWMFLDTVSVKETKSFSSSEGYILNSPFADKFFSLLTILSSQNKNSEPNEGAETSENK